jgi:hypothetical protein
MISEKEDRIPDYLQKKMADGEEYNYLQEREISIAEREDRDSKKEVNIRSLDDLDEDERKAKIEEIQEHKREAEAFPYHAKTSGPMLRSAGNTGPKSVKKDYEEAKERARLRVMKQNEESWKKIEQSALVHKGGSVIAQQPLPMPPPRREEGNSFSHLALLNLCLLHLFCLPTFPLPSRYSSICSWSYLPRPLPLSHYRLVFVIVQKTEMLKKMRNSRNHSTKLVGTKKTKHSSNNTTKKRWKRCKLTRRNRLHLSVKFKKSQKVLM